MIIQLDSLVFAYYYGRCRQWVDTVQGGPKSKPLPNYHKIVLNRIKICQWDKISSSY